MISTLSGQGKDRVPDTIVENYFFLFPFLILRLTGQGGQGRHSRNMKIMYKK